FHGNGQNLSTHFTSLKWILDYDYDFFIFDYPGYGGSQGEPTQASTVDAGLKAMDWLIRNKPELPTVIFGQSLGGNIALYTVAQQQDHQPCLVVVDSTFKSYRKVAQRILANNALTWLLQPIPYLLIAESYSAIDEVDKIAPTPLIVIHGDQDQVVDIQNGRDVYAAAKEPKEFWLVKGVDHIQSLNGKQQDIVRRELLNSLEYYCSSHERTVKSDNLKSFGN
ncbi:MAG: alpha/beta hydrolase, partial [Bdellovibrio sp.]|nr:alpha/beta hydrolase [Bdellovibrio sp.]